MAASEGAFFNNEPGKGTTSSRAVSATHSDPASAAEAVGTAAEKARRERRRSLVLPREHGAWGLLLVPLVTGAGIAFSKLGAPHASQPLRDAGIIFSPIVSSLLLLTAALALFWLRTPVESLLGTSVIRAQTTQERRAIIFVIACLVSVTALALVTLLWAGRNPYLWLIGVAAAAAFVAQAVLKNLGRRTRMLSEIVGTMGLTLSAPAAYYVITGEFDATAWMLWLANLAFAGNQIHYVQLRIHTARAEGVRVKFARGWAFAVGQVLMVAVLCVVRLLGLIPWLALVGFVPILFRGFVYFFRKPAPLVVRRLGWSELGQAVMFCVLFIAGFALAG